MVEEYDKQWNVLVRTLVKKQQDIQNSLISQSQKIEYLNFPHKKIQDRKLSDFRLKMVKNGKNNENGPGIGTFRRNTVTGTSPQYSPEYSSGQKLKLENRLRLENGHKLGSELDVREKDGENNENETDSDNDDDSTSKEDDMTDMVKSKKKGSGQDKDRDNEKDKDKSKDSSLTLNSSQSLTLTQNQNTNQNQIKPLLRPATLDSLGYRKTSQNSQNNSHTSPKNSQNAQNSQKNSQNSQNSQKNSMNSKRLDSPSYNSKGGWDGDESGSGQGQGHDGTYILM